PIFQEHNFRNWIPVIVPTGPYVVSSRVVRVVWCFRRIQYQRHIENAIVITVGVELEEIRVSMIVTYVSAQFSQSVQQFKGAVNPATVFLTARPNSNARGITVIKCCIHLSVFSATINVYDVPVTEGIIGGNLIIPIGAVSQILATPMR